MEPPHSITDRSPFEHGLESDRDLKGRRGPIRTGCPVGKPAQPCVRCPTGRRRRRSRQSLPRPHRQPAPRLGEVARKWIGKFWSTERELNPRILVLQTSALATSPSVLIAAACLQTSNAHGGCIASSCRPNPASGSIHTPTGAAQSSAGTASPSCTRGRSCPLLRSSRRR